MGNMGHGAMPMDHKPMDHNAMPGMTPPAK
jgi:hypothetical protein